MSTSPVTKSNINFKKAGFFYLLGTLFNKGVAFLTVPIFTRILTTTEYGIVTTYNSWVGIFAMVLGFALHMSVRAAFVDYKNRIYDFLSTIILFTVGTAGSVVCVLIIGVKALHLDISLIMILLCIIQGASNAIIEDCSVMFMMQYRYKCRTALMILPSFVSSLISIAVIMLVMNSDKYWGRIVPTSITYLIIAVVVFVYILLKKKVLFDFELLKYGFKISSPLIVHGIALNILTQSDRTMITVFCDASQTGIYSLVFNFSMIATVIMTSLDGLWVPWFTDKMKEGKRDEINSRVTDYIKLMAYLMSGLVLIGPEILKLLADPTYWEGIIIIPPIVVLNFVIFAYTLYVNIEHFHKKTVCISKNTIIAAISNLVLNFIFIPYFGYIAAAYTTLASYLICFVLHAIDSKKIEPKLYPIKYFATGFTYVFISIVVFYILKDLVLLRWIYTIIYVAVILFKERKKIKYYMQSKEKGK